MMILNKKISYSTTTEARKRLLPNYFKYSQSELDTLQMLSIFGPNIVHCEESNTTNI